MLLAYQALSALNHFQYDYAQVNAVAKLDDLSQNIYQQEQQSWLSKRLNKPIVIPGIYFYGRVGRGKTMLMDLFFQHLAITVKKRIHFHRFMEEVHQQLNLCSGESDPLTFIAKRWAKKLRCYVLMNFLFQTLVTPCCFLVCFKHFFSKVLF
jgi:cell division protein ZapE